MKWIPALLALLLPALLPAQDCWVLLADRGPGVQERLDSLPRLYTPRALARYARHGKWPGQSDLPPHPAYLQAIRATGAHIHGGSRWQNAVWTKQADSAALAALPFVRRVVPIPTKGPGTQVAACTYSPGTAGTMNREHDYTGLASLHCEGHTGQGVLMAVFDSGFLNVHTLPGFDSLRLQNRLVAYYDFVNNDDGVFDEDNHGTAVLSRIAGHLPDSYRGTAPRASILLARTETIAGETPQEMLNWQLAAEWADLQGADIISSSLGYNDFEGTASDLTLNDLDGNTALITRAADSAAARGILVVVSAGNEGAVPNWGRITSPCDGDSVLCVGSIDRGSTLIAASSGRGPTTDGRLKPEVNAMGQNVPVLSAAGGTGSSTGTSFSAPYVAGMAACLLSAYPQATAWQLREALIRSADRYLTPDNAYGHGTPMAQQAQQWLGCQLGQCPQGSFVLQIGPNPTSGTLRLYAYLDGSTEPLHWQLIDAQGRIAATGSLPTATTHTLDISSTAPGLYLMRIELGGRVLHRRIVRQ